jgi:ABC-type phosphate/phosphonate transport system substrate-binding protein
MKAILALAAGLALAVPTLNAEEKKPFHLVVMDPLALELSCPCVKGSAQRNYNKLGKMLEDRLGRPVKVHFSESLSSALKKSGGEADLIIGKDSVIRSDAKGAKIEVSAIASLTGKDGKTTQNGLFLVAAKDSALSVSDLKGYRIIFGPSHCDEKHKAALDLLKEFKVNFEVLADKKVETCAGCDEGATTILDLSKTGVKAATVISSYAHPLLEGCGTVKKGDLRIIGETESVPFVAVFVAGRVSESDRETVTKSLLAVGKNADLCTALETKLGFVPIEAKYM